MTDSPKQIVAKDSTLYNKNPNSSLDSDIPKKPIFSPIDTYKNQIYNKKATSKFQGFSPVNLSPSVHNSMDGDNFDQVQDFQEENFKLNPRIFVNVNIYINPKPHNEQITTNYMSQNNQKEIDDKRSINDQHDIRESGLIITKTDTLQKPNFFDHFFQNSEERQFTDSHSKKELSVKFPYNAHILTKRNELSSKCSCLQIAHRENAKLLKHSRIPLISKLSNYWKNNTGQFPAIFRKKLIIIYEDVDELSLNEVLDLSCKLIGDEKEL